MLSDVLTALTAPQPHNLHVREAFFARPLKDQLRQIEDDLGGIPREQFAKIAGPIGAVLQRPFIPQPGPQTQALNSLADELLFGGQAGGGKSSLLIGATQDHKRSLILRRQSSELDGLIAEVHSMFGRDGWRAEGSGGTHTEADFAIRLGGCREPEDWRAYAGRARDYMGFDEAAEFLEDQVASLIGWLRSTDPNQRCRVILASNPPRDAEGQWIVEWFAPWLEPSFPDPARNGELRWFIVANSKTRWVDTPGEYIVDGETYTARSRTFVPAHLDDNAFLARTNYIATLRGLREPLRSQLLHGNFLAGREDGAWQLIKSAWIQAARQRWTEQPPVGVGMTCVGVDIAQGGPDQTVLAARRGSWFAPLAVYEGLDTRDGPSVAALVLTAMRDGCTAAIDLGGGWGGSTFDHLKQNGIPVEAVEPGAGSTLRTRDGMTGFANKRAELWWRFAEALDPNSGAYIALPPDPALAAELAAPSWKMTARGILVQSKEEIRKSLHRSTDRADAVVMSWGYGNERAMARSQPRQMRAIVGHATAKRYGNESSGRYQRRAR